MILFVLLVFLLTGGVGMAPITSINGGRVFKVFRKTPHVEREVTDNDLPIYVLIVILTRR